MNPMAKSLDDVAELILKEIKANTSIVDQGIGFFEFWGHTGIDKQMTTETELEKVFVDITDVPMEDEDDEELKSFRLSTSVDGGGDEDACAFAGRRHCGSCDKCKSYDVDFTAELSGIKVVEGRKIAEYIIKE